MPDLSAELISRTLTTRRLGRPARYFPAIGSTNDVAHAEARAGAADGLLVIADAQTAGRGRLDRRWWAPPGACLLMSLLLRPDIPLRHAGQLTMCLGLGAVAGIADVTGVRAELKWPNDLVLDGRKLGGMLAELRTEGDRLDYAVLGLGINVNVIFEAGDGDANERQSMKHGDNSSRGVRPPADLIGLATSLQMAGGRPVDRLALLTSILTHTEAWLDRTRAGESPHEAWAARLDTLGRQVTVSTATGTLHGQALGVTPEGGLRVCDAHGREHVIWSGDVTSLRPAA